MLDDRQTLSGYQMCQINHSICCTSARTVQLLIMNKHQYVPLSKTKHNITKTVHIQQSQYTNKLLVPEAHESEIALRFSYFPCHKSARMRFGRRNHLREVFLGETSNIFIHEVEMTLTTKRDAPWPQTTQAN